MYFMDGCHTYTLHVIVTVYSVHDANSIHKLMIFFSPAWKLGKFETENFGE